MDPDLLKDLDLSKYIEAEKLAAMSDLEQRCCANRIRNYEMLKSLGNIPLPCCYHKSYLLVFV